MVKRFKKTKNGKFFLLAESENIPPLEIKEENNIYIWGVVTNAIHPV